MGGDTVYYGWGTTEEGYIKYQKKYYIFRELAWAIIVIVAYSYFICVCGRYSSKLLTKRDDENKKQYAKDKEFREIAQKALDEIAKNGGVEPKKKKKKDKKDDAAPADADAAAEPAPAE